MHKHSQSCLHYMTWCTEDVHTVRATVWIIMKWRSNNDSAKWKHLKWNWIRCPEHVSFSGSFMKIIVQYFLFCHWEWALARLKMSILLVKSWFSWSWRQQCSPHWSLISNPQWAGVTVRNTAVICWMNSRIFTLNSFTDIDYNINMHQYLLFFPDLSISQYSSAL